MVKSTSEYRDHKRFTQLISLHDVIGYINFYFLLYQHLRSPGNAYVEGDASSASYFLAGAAVTGGTVTVEGCGTTSLQVIMFFRIYNNTCSITDNLFQLRNLQNLGRF